ncbi:MAG: hypothetical protein JNL50_08385 [Phycisphaerae bacterium]|nr:hypothetical protein [Phycisphaerae bacterium]
MNWELLPTGPNGIDGPTSWTFCLMEWQGMVLAGCDSVIGTSEQASGVAAWDGVNWRPLGEAPPYILALAPAEDGGVLALSFAETPTKVYRYDGVAWTLVGLGPADVFDEWRVCLAEYQGKVIVGFAGPNGNGLPSLYVLENGISVPWVQMEYYSYSSGVTSMIIHEGRLVVAGDFNRIGSVYANSIASWDGQTWRPFGGGIYLHSHDFVIDIEDVCAIDGVLHVANYGYSIDEWMGPVARWSGTEWVHLGQPQSFTWAWAVEGQCSEVVCGGYDLDTEGCANFSRCAPTGAPWTAWQPDDQTVFPGMSATFAGVAAAGHAVAYQWYKDGEALSDGPTAHGSVVCGSHDAWLTLLGCRGQDKGLYWCVVSNGCGTDESRHASLTVCVADVNSDGFVNGDDFDLFAGWYEEAVVFADFNGDGFVNGDDYDEFAQRFDGGC